ncbi:hypothetical protein ACTA71_005383 [Dictyostelium dimigraforme]
MPKVILQTLKSNIKGYFLIFVFFISNFALLNCQQLNIIEYNCLKGLCTNLGLINKVGLNYTTKDYLFCGTQDRVYPTIEIKCQNNSVSYLNLGTTNPSYEISNEFSCFKNLTSLRFIEMVFDKDIFYNTYPPKATNFSLDGHDLVYGPIPSTIKSFSSTINYQQRITTPIKFSWYLNTNEINFLTLTNLRGYNLHRFDNDLDGSITWYSNIRIVSLNVPSLNFISGNISLTLLEGYDQSSWSNISTFGGMNTIIIVADLVPEISPFPIQLSQLRSKRLHSMYLDVPFFFSDINY